MRKRLVALALLLGACTSAAPPVGSPTSPRPSATESAPRVRFEAARVLAHDRALAVGIGTREAGSAAFRRAADYAASVLAGLGYGIRRMTVPIPAGRSEGVPVAAGSTQNVIAYPPGFDPAAPHILAGAHLDTVAVSPGANDNASGSAMVLELARLARLERTALPVVWALWGGEERRLKGPSGASFGSRAYLDGLPAAERAALRGVLAIDMVGNGPSVLVCHGGRTPRPFVRALLDTASRLSIPAEERVVRKFFSDHTPFENAGFTVAWLWAGDHPTVHTPADRIDVVQLAELSRVGVVAWETLRSLRL
jgi:hypothetical protein